MKHFKLLIILSLLFSFKCFSQTPTDPNSHTPQQNADEITNSMTCELGLSKDQVSRMAVINLDACKKMDDALKTSGSDKKLLDKKEDAIEKIWYSQVKGVLSHKQWGLYEKISNGDQKSLKLTRVCRPPQDSYSGF